MPAYNTNPNPNDHADNGAGRSESWDMTPAIQTATVSRLAQLAQTQHQLDRVGRVRAQYELQVQELELSRNENLLLCRNASEEAQVWQMFQRAKLQLAARAKSRRAR